jgi:hypothetical protein
VNCQLTLSWPEADTWLGFASVWVPPVNPTYAWPFTKAVDKSISGLVTGTLEWSRYTDSSPGV